ncbi:MAG: DivIVA domain-containing protein [Actinomycetota bacterium]
MDLDPTDIEIRTFDVVRRGYDREQVEEFLTTVSGAMSSVRERRKIAEVRVEQLERELHDVKHRADVTIQETVAARIRMLEIQGKPGTPTEGAPSPDVSRGHAEIEAHHIIEQANVRAIALQAEAEAVLEGALSTSAKINDDRTELLGSVVAERGGIIAAAEQEAQAIREAAQIAAEQSRANAARETEQMRSGAARVAEETRKRADMEADLVKEDAATRASGIVAGAERKREELIEQVERSREVMASIERRDADVGERETASAGAPPTPGEDAVDEQIASPREPDLAEDPDRSKELEKIMIDLRAEIAAEEESSDVRQTRPSRYRSRSANLPHLGEDAESVIGSLESLRGKN